jgi:drug/metabolite transporter (DMT)-like permease
MNPAPAHLEAKLRFGWDFTVGQIAAMIAGILIGFAWANWISPIRGIGAAVTGVYVGGMPVAAGFIASQTEFDLWAVLSSAVRWRRVGGRFVSGAGEVGGYLVLVEDEQHGAGDRELAVLDRDVLWSDDVSSARTRTGPSVNGARGR